MIIKFNNNNNNKNLTSNFQSLLSFSYSPEEQIGTSFEYFYILNLLIKTF